MRRLSLRLHLVLVASALSVAGCFVQIDDLERRACDDAHACSAPLVCFRGRCVDAPEAVNPKLSWRPPQLSNPITLTLGTGPTNDTLQDDRDYLVKLPETTKVGHTTLVGGRNIVLIGGRITIPPSASGDLEHRSLYIKDARGTVHIEGLLIDHSGGGGSTGIALSAPDAVVQLQNIRATELDGQASPSARGTLIHTFGGVKELRVDRFTGSSSNAGLELGERTGPVGPIDLRRVNVSYWHDAELEGGALLALTGAPGCEVGSVRLTEVYAVPMSGRTLSDSVYPSLEDGACPPVTEDQALGWPSLPNIEGRLQLGPPWTGDFVPDGVAGVRYTSPGYVE